MKKKINIVDTTLRDGEQRAGLAFEMQEKLYLASLIDACGVSEIEAGISSRELEGDAYYSELRNYVKHAKLSLWSRMVLEDVKEAISCQPDMIHVGVPVSYVHIYSKLKKNKTWVQKRICECMDLVQKNGIEIVLGFEDASRADMGFLIDTAKLIEEMGGKTLRIADTVGIFTPGRTIEIISQLSEKVGLDIEFHGHNDLGMVVANSMSAANAGAKFVDCTLLGIGERCGNCDMLGFYSATTRFFDTQIDLDAVKKAQNMLQSYLVRA